MFQTPVAARSLKFRHSENDDLRMAKAGAEGNAQRRGRRDGERDVSECVRGGRSSGFGNRVSKQARASIRYSWHGYLCHTDVPLEYPCEETL